jgi:hypothetical protein
MTNDELTALPDSIPEQAADPSLWKDMTFEATLDVPSVVSVRFRRGELAEIERTARVAAQPLATYVQCTAILAAQLGKMACDTHWRHHARAMWCTCAPRVVYYRTMRAGGGYSR